MTNPADAKVQRRLSAILAADVVGFSALMSQDEEGTLARIKSLRRELIEPMVHAHYGRVVKTAMQREPLLRADRSQPGAEGPRSGRGGEHSDPWSSG